ncbi:hypothetical protein ACFLTD_00515 [Elusimicrobiota bacterium]
MTIPVFPVPQNLTVDAVHISSITAYWDLAEGATSYTLVCSTLSTSPPVDIFASSATYGNSSTTTTLTGLWSNTTYYLFVRSHGGGQDSDYSSSVTTCTLANVPSGSAFTGVYISSVTIQWTTNNSTSNTRYEAQVSTDGNFDPVFAENIVYTSDTSTQTVFKELSNLTTYYFRVRAVNHSGIPTNWDTTVSTVTKNIPGLSVLDSDDIRLYYGSQSDPAYPRSRTWDDSETSWASEVYTEDIQSTITWIVSKKFYADKELVLILSDTGSSTSLDMLRWDGNIWYEDWTSAAIVQANADMRGYDMEYEHVASSNALVVYSDNTSNPVYRTWNGTSWSSETQVFGTPPGSGVVEWVELESHPWKGEIQLAYSDSNRDLFAVVWDGDSWDTSNVATLDTALNTVSGNYGKNFDIAYGVVTGDVIIAWSGAATGSNSEYSLRSAGATSWSAAAGINAPVNGLPDMIELASEPGGIRIAGVFGDFDGTERLGLATWDGFNWVDQGEYDSQIRDQVASGDINCAVGWVGSSGEAICVFSDNGTGGIHWANWTSAGGWSIQSDESISGMGYIESVQIESFNEQDKLMAVISDSNNDLFAATYESGSWTITNGGNSLVSNVSSNISKPFYFSVYEGKMIYLAEHTSDQQENVFTDKGDLDDKELFRFRLAPYSSTAAITVSQIVFSINDIVGLSDDDWNEVEICVDTNSDGQIGAGETGTVGGSPTVNQSAGTITFQDDFNVTEFTDYILVADINSIESGDRVTIGLNTGNITVLDGVSVNGSVSAAIHSFGIPLLDIDDARLIYGIADNPIPRILTWDMSVSTWSLVYSAEEARSLVMWTLNKVSPVRCEELFTVLSNTGTAASLDMLRWDGNHWTKDWTSGSIVSNNTVMRGYDIEYELSSGDALAVYSDNTSNPVYRTWDGTSWSSETQVFGTPPGSGVVEWVELESRPGTDEIQLAYADSNRDLFAVVWDGDSWDTSNVATLDTALNTVSGNYGKNFDIAYEETTGDVIIAWSGSATASNAEYSLRSAGATSWSAASGINAPVNGYPDMIGLASEPGGTRIAGVFGDFEGTKRLGLATWNGSSWVNQGEYDSDIRDQLASGDINCAVGWVGSSGEAICVFSDNGTGGIHWANWTSAGGWSIQSDETISGMGYIESVQIESFTTEDKLLAVFSDSFKQLWGAEYNGTDWSVSKSTFILSDSLSSINTKPFSFAISEENNQAPVSLTVDAVYISSITANWDLVSDATGYTLVASTFPNNPPIEIFSSTMSVGVNSTTGTLTGLYSNTTYYLFVHSNKSGSSSSYSPYVSTVTLANPPSGLAFAGVYISSVTIQWTTNNSTSNTRYEAQVSTGSSFDPVFAENTVYTSDVSTQTVFRGLSDLTTWYFRVRAVNHSGIPTEWVTSITTVTLAYGATNYRSIGINSGILENAGNASIDKSTNVVTFSVAISTMIGQGDKLTLNTSGNREMYYILSRDDDTHVTLQNVTVSTHTNVSYTITRAFNTMQAWADARGGDLVADNRLEMGVCYNDGPFTDRLTITGNITDPDHYMYLTVAQGHRHDGTANCGTYIDREGNADNAIEILEDDYAAVEWIRISNFSSQSFAIASGIYANNVTLVKIFNVIIHDGSSSGAMNAKNLYGIYDQGNAGLLVANCIIYNLIADNGNAYDAIAMRFNETSQIYNCTVYNIINEGTGDAWGYWRNSGNVTLRNCIALNCQNLDYNGTFINAGNNISSDDTAPGANSMHWLKDYDLFVSTETGNEDFHLKDTAVAINRATDTVSGIFANDIDDDSRPYDLEWDIGADESPYTAAPYDQQLAAVYQSSITARWDLVGDATGYTLAASTFPDNPPVEIFSSSMTVGVNSTTGTVTGLYPNTTYYLFVRKNKAGSGSAYVACPATATLADPVTSANIYAVHYTSVTLNWAAHPATPSSSTCEGYIVQASSMSDFSNIYGSASTADINITTLTVIGLEQGVTYWFRVGSLNWNDAANYESVGSTETMFLLGVPQNLTVDAVHISSITAHWDLVSGATAYTLVCSTLSTNPPVDIFASSTTYGSDSTATTLTGLWSNTTYYLFVRARGGGQTSDYSSSVTTCTLANVPSGSAFAGVYISSVTIQWTTNNSTSNTRYEAQVSTGSSFDPVFAENTVYTSDVSTQTVFKGLSDLTTWYFRVRAVNHSGVPTEWVTSITTVTLAHGATNYRSIGTNSGILENAGNASVDKSTNVVTFSVVISTMIGQGDKLTLNTSGNREMYYILSRDDDTHVTLQDVSVSTHTNASYTITRAFNKIQKWEDTREGDLVADKRLEVGVCYDDGLFDELITISGSTTSVVNYMHLTAAAGHRHNGTILTGVTIDPTGVLDVVTINDSYTVVEWLVIRDYGGTGWYANGIQINSSSTTVKNNIIADGEADNHATGIWVAGTNNLVFNNIIYDQGTNGIVIVESTIT